MFVRPGETGLCLAGCLVNLGTCLVMVHAMQSSTYAHTLGRCTPWAIIIPEVKLKDGLSALTVMIFEDGKIVRRTAGTC